MAKEISYLKIVSMPGLGVAEWAKEQWQEGMSLNTETGSNDCSRTL